MRERYRRKAEEIKAYQKAYRKENAEKIKVTRRPYQRKRYLLRRLARKVALMDAMGGKCIKCGFDQVGALQFHHRDPQEKRFAICDALNSGYKMKYSWEEILKEVEKCDLICANCHHLEHSQWSEEETIEMYRATEQYHTAIKEACRQLAEEYWTEEEKLLV